MMWIVAACVAVALVAFLVLQGQKSTLAQKGISGTVRYRDAAGRGQTLVSHVHKLAGKPDYIVSEGGQPVPVEVKSREVTDAGAYEGELLQLAGYCILVEEHYGPVSKGRLVFANGSVDVPFGDHLRQRLLRSLEALRECAGAQDVPRSHASSARCGGCGYRDRCSEALA